MKLIDFVRLSGNTVLDSLITQSKLAVTVHIRGSLQGPIWQKDVQNVLQPYSEVLTGKFVKHEVVCSQ